MKDSKKIFKIFTPLQWGGFQRSGVFHGSDLDIKDGFIHLSFSNQWKDIWDKIFKKDEIYLVEMYDLDPQLLKIESNKLGGAEYQHYYGGSLTRENVKEVTKILAD